MSSQRRTMQRYPANPTRRAWPVRIRRPMRAVRHGAGLALARAYREGA